MLANHEDETTLFCIEPEDAGRVLRFDKDGRLVMRSDLLEEIERHKTGVYRDKLGHRYRLQDGVRVPIGDDEKSAPKLVNAKLNGQEVQVVQSDPALKVATDHADAGKGDPGAGPGAATPAKADLTAPITKDRTTPPPPAKETAPLYEPDPTKDTTGNGVADASRVGVPADQVPPPPPIGRLPRLTKNERLVEARFADAFQSDPQKMIDAYADGRNKQVGVDKNGDPKYEIGDAPNVFSTDDAKMLSDVYNPPADSGISPEDRLALRSRYNTVLHQTANAVAKKAFLQYLDQMPEGNKTVLVTNGGVAAGKDYALARVDAVNNVAKLAGAVWNSAGEQNSTENTWIINECEKRGINATFVFVHADPDARWENPKSGVVERAGKVGRMVDARLFADSYAIGPKNFAAFHKANEHNPNAQFFVLDNTGEKPVQVPEVPSAALQIDSEALYHRCVGFLQNADGVHPAVKRGGTNGLRIWPEKQGASVKESRDAHEFAARGPSLSSDGGIAARTRGENDSEQSAQRSLSLDDSANTIQ